MKDACAKMLDVVNITVTLGDTSLTLVCVPFDIATDVHTVIVVSVF